MESGGVEPAALPYVLVGQSVPYCELSSGWSHCSREVSASYQAAEEGFRGDVRAAGMTALSLSDALQGGLTACGGPGPRGL